ncbi:MAG: hypothetical protein J6U98_05215 [Abditibacteriota bacterium]|nr:hypothetical protein [Abditibacteriota bacterium]
MRNIGKEILYGGIFGCIAVIAVVIEVFLGGFSIDAVIGGIKDISGTIVAVLVFLIAIRQFRPSKSELSFEERLSSALDKWCMENANMIVRNERIDGHAYGIGMRTDIQDFYRSVPLTKQAGRFVQMPIIDAENYNKNDIKLTFELKKGIFFSDRPELQGEELNKAFNSLNELFCGYINNKFAGFASASGKDDSITVVIREPIVTDEDISRLIDLINTVYQAYLTAANVNKK